MIAGAIFFLALTVGLLSTVFGFQLPRIAHLESRPGRPNQKALMTGYVALATIPQQNSGRSRFQKDRSSIEDIRAANRRVQRILEGKSESEGQQLNAEASGTAKESVAKQRPAKSSGISKSTDSILNIIFLLGKVITLFVSVIFAALGFACVRRAILFFINKLEIRVDNANLYLTQPKLLGGVKVRSYSLATMGPIHCRAVEAGESFVDGETYGTSYTVWTVLLMSRSKEVPPLEFRIEQTVTGSAVRPPKKTIDFANGLAGLTGLPMVPCN